MGIWYATRERVSSSLEIAHTAKNAAIIDACLDAATPAVESLLHQRFYPEQATRKIDFPNFSYSPTWQLDLQGNYIISATSLVAGGVTISSSDYILRRWDDKQEPPYQYLEIDLSSSSAFAAGPTFQQAIQLTGLYGWNDTDTSIVHALLGGSVNASVTTFVLNPSSGIYEIGVGSILLIGTERCIITNRRMSDTGVNLTANLDDSQADVVLTVGDGTAFAVGETILIGPERMRIDDIAGNSLIVTRAFDGSLLDVHTAPLDIYALRTCTVSRGALGSTATSHSANDSVYVHKFPPLVTELAVAETVVMLEQNAAAYARMVGSGASARESGGQGLIDLRNMAVTAYARKARSAAI